MSARIQAPHSFREDLRRVLPVFAIVFLTTAAALGAIRLGARGWLEKGIYSQADSCQVSEVRYQAARTLWRRLAREALPDPSVPNTRPQSALGRFKGDERLTYARAHLREALRLCPRQSGVHAMLADIAWWEGDQPATHYHLGLEHLQAREFDAARAELSAAGALDPDSTPVALALLTLYERTQDWTAAGSYIESLEPAHRETPTGLRIRGRLALQQGRLDDARALLQQSLEAEPGQPDAIEALLRSWIPSDPLAACRWALENLRRSVAPEAGSYHRIATILHSQGEFESALEAVQLAAAIQPNNIQLQVEKALNLYELGRTEEARAALSSALSRDAREFMRVMQENRFAPLADVR